MQQHLLRQRSEIGERGKIQRGGGGGGGGGQEKEGIERGCRRGGT